jgi:hypothetical protein
MSIIDDEHLLTRSEEKGYQDLLKLHNYKAHDFLVEVTEDQQQMDMNDLDYVIILKINVKNLESGIENTYFSKLNSQTWLTDFERDLLDRYYER